MRIKIRRKNFLTEMAKIFLNQKGLAEKLEITPQAVNAFLKGRNFLSIATAKKACDLFGRKFEDLFEIVGE